MKKIIVIFSILLSTVLSGCRDWLDINENPNYVSDADKTALLPTVALETADKAGYELTLGGYFWSQLVGQGNETNQFVDLMTYNLNTQSSYFTNPWAYIYSRVFPSIKTILAQCEGESNVSNFVFEAKTLLAYNLYLLTSLYDEVAYTEGCLGDETNTTPHFDSGEKMQEVIVGLLEELRAMDAAQLATDEETNTSTTSDMIFGGDMEQWVKVANTL